VYNEVLNYRANLSHKRTLCAAAVIRGWCQRSVIQSVSANINTQVDIALSVSDRSMVTAGSWILEIFVACSRQASCTRVQTWCSATNQLWLYDLSVKSVFSIRLCHARAINPFT